MKTVEVEVLRALHFQWWPRKCVIGSQERLPLSFRLWLLQTRVIVIDSRQGYVLADEKLI